MATQFELKVVPCIDSFLYAPVYLALIELRRLGTSIPDEKKIIITGLQTKRSDRGQAPDTLTITYGQAAGGDEETIKMVQPDNFIKTVTIGICDPKTVIETNFRARNGKPEEWSATHEIIAVLIDRIGLALLARKPQFMKNKASYKVRNKALETIIGKFRAERISGPGVLQGHSHEIIYDYWSLGQTTKFLANKYLQVADSNLLTGKDAADNVDRLLRGDIDIAITHAPWEIQEKHKKRLEIFSRECFPAIQFPFSCVVAPKVDSTETPALEWVLGQFNNALYKSIALINREPVEAINLLVRDAGLFRNYGIKDCTMVQQEASRAINHFLVSGCYSDGLWPEWTAWHYALSLDEAWREKGAWWRTASEVLGKTLNRKYCKWMDLDDSLKFQEDMLTEFEQLYLYAR